MKIFCPFRFRFLGFWCQMAGDWLWSQNLTVWPVWQPWPKIRPWSYHYQFTCHLIIDMRLLLYFRWRATAGNWLWKRQEWLFDNQTSFPEQQRVYPLSYTITILPHLPRGFNCKVLSHGTIFTMYTSLRFWELLSLHIALRGKYHFLPLRPRILSFWQYTM